MLYHLFPEHIRENEPDPTQCSDYEPLAEQGTIRDLLEAIAEITYPARSRNGYSCTLLEKGAHSDYPDAVGQITRVESLDRQTLSATNYMISEVGGRLYFEKDAGTIRVVRPVSILAESAVVQGPDTHEPTQFLYGSEVHLVTEQAARDLVALFTDPQHS